MAHLKSDTIFSACDGLGWKKHKLYDQIETNPFSSCFAYTTPNSGPAVWLAAGIHGEEPAGPEAIAKSIPFLSQLGKSIPIVLLPLLNPSGFNRGWRYFNEFRTWQLGKSVGDMSHILFPQHPNNPYCEKLGDFTIQTAAKYPPLIFLDFHEDEQVNSGGYIYPLGNNYRPLLSELLQVHSSQIKLANNDSTRFFEPIKSGLVWSEPNGSYEDLLISLDCPAVFTLELPTAKPLETRVDTYQNHLYNLPKLLKLLA